MTLLAIIVATLVAGVGSVWLAALLGFGMLARYTQHMLSLAAGALLATAFMHLLPEAFDSTRPNSGTTAMSITTLLSLKPTNTPVMPTARALTRIHTATAMAAVPAAAGPF